MMLPTGIRNAPVYFNVEANTDYVWRDVGSSGHRFYLTPEVAFPLWLGPYVEFEPSIRYSLNTQVYDDNRGNREDHIRGAYDARVRIMTNLARTYEVNWWRAKRLKHRIWPQLSYRYRGVHGDSDLRPWFEEIYIEGRINRATFSLANFLDARLENKQGDVTYRQWATFDLSQTYDIAEARRDTRRWIDREPFRPLSAELIVRPLRYLDLRGGVRWDHYDLTVADSNVSFDLSVDRAGGRKDKYKIDYIYVRDNPERLSEYDWDIQTNLEHSLNVHADVNIAFGFYVGGSLENNLGESEVISNSYWLGYQSQCWGTKFLVEMEDDEMTFMVGINLLGLGEFAAGQKFGE
jgi:LPS-assembly protein